ncbi:DUF188 domain-containing protein [Sutcliffiella cohnii]|uniref:DUF188 domain-containing protein n=1 Tax=Sutcliffiella cohnii TaxID=33932 RepID=UPI000AC67027|nr:DUF188 domain-containing protein [Sutcliffiella cohnii]MED4016503.1 DUF188 domain-containing protein [Sutcliffiella cohnii]
MNAVKKGDVVITQDHGLASMLIGRNVYVISSRGKVYKEDEMDFSLHLRYLSANKRRSGKYVEGPKPFTEENDSNLLLHFQEFCRTMKEFKILSRIL